MPSVETPIPLTAYPSSTDGTWVFPWALVFDPVVHDPSTLIYELVIDTFPTFASPNLRRVIVRSDSVGFENGDLGKAIAVSLPKRHASQDTTWYWCVRVNGGGYGGGYVSEWTNTNVITIPSNKTLEQASVLFNNVADENAYSKDSKSSDLYKILDMIGRELDQLLFETYNTTHDASIDTVRETAVENNFGKLIELAPVPTEADVSYRWKVRELFKSFLNSAGVINGIERVVKAFVGENPTIYDAGGTIGWFLPLHYVKHPEHPELTPTIVLYNNVHGGFTWKLKVWNSWGFSYDQNTFEAYIDKIKPSHTKITYTYETQKHAQIKFDTAEDWNSCTLTNAIVVNDSVQFTGSTYKTITVDSTSVANQGPAASLTWAHTCSGDDRLLVVAADTVGTVGIASVTYNGVAMTRKVTGAGSANGQAFLYYLIAPPVGTYNIVITWDFALTGTKYVSATSFNNVHQTTAIGNFGYQDDTTVHTTTRTVTLLASAGDVVIDCLVQGTSSAEVATQSVGQTVLSSQGVAGNYQSSSIKAGATSVTTTWSWSTACHACLVAMVIKPSEYLTATVETPVIHISNLNAWDTVLLDQALSGQVIEVDMRTSVTGNVGTFSPYIALVDGEVPTSPPINPYVQFQILLTRTNTAYTPIFNSLKLNVLHL